MGGVFFKKNRRGPPKKIPKIGNRPPSFKKEIKKRRGKNSFLPKTIPPQNISPPLYSPPNFAPLIMGPFNPKEELVNNCPPT